MANPHHRKKHKEHLKQFQQRQSNFSKDVKGSAANIFAIVGAVIGFAIAYFASGDLIWMVITALITGIAGYFTGKRIDNAGSK